MRRANGKEIYAACLILLIGVVYLAGQIDAMFSISSTSVKGDVIQLSMNEMLSHFRSILTIVLCFTGAILLLKIKKTGWIICQSVFLLFMTIALGIYISNIDDFMIVGIILIAGVIMLVVAFVFLFQRHTREKFMVSNKNYISVIIFFGLLSIFYYLLQ